MTIHAKSYPRAALIGNPSDGYFGKTIAFVFRNFSAEVRLEPNNDPTDELVIVPGVRDIHAYSGIEALANDVQQHGYYGGQRLLKASLKKFYEYCQTYELHLKSQTFRLSYKSNIPVRLGLAGSSAIITACMKCLMEFYEIEIAKPLLANLILSVETEELGISAGLQDRVAQVYEHPIYMDFDRNLMDQQGFGRYEWLDAAKLPPLYIAYRTDLSEGSEIVHNDFRDRFERHDPDVLVAIQEWAELTERVKEALEEGRGDSIGDYINLNFDLRKRVMKVGRDNVLMVELARSVGASAKFTGSGGAIIGTYTGESMLEELTNVMKKNDIEVIRPEIVH